MITALIPTYNRGHMISNAICSMLGQTYGSVAIIVYDDGSTDNTEQVMKSYPAVTYIKSRDNKGIVHARNFLLSKVKTKYACWQDSDDTSDENRIKEQLLAIGDKVVCYTHWKNLLTGECKEQIAFASALFDVKRMPKFKLMARNGVTTNIAGEDAELFERIQENQKIVLKKPLYNINFHRERVGNWKRTPSMNQDWYNRMLKT